MLFSIEVSQYLIYDLDLLKVFTQADQGKHKDREAVSDAGTEV